MDCTEAREPRSSQQAMEVDLAQSGSVNSYSGSQGEGSKYVGRERHSPAHGGTVCNSNGEASNNVERSLAAQASGSECERCTVTSRNKQAQNSVDMVPGLLSTPPLTPPQQEAVGRQQQGQLQEELDSVSSPDPSPLLVIAEPMNGNRNNVADSVHANSASFKSTTGHHHHAVLSNGLPGKQQPPSDIEGPKIRSGGVQGRGSPAQSRLDLEPPALVVIDRGEGRREEREKEERMDIAASSASPVDKQDSSRDREKFPRDKAGSLQSTVVTSVAEGRSLERRDSGRGEDDDDDDEDIDIDLVVVEDEEEAGLIQQATPTEGAASSKSSSPSSHSQHSRDGEGTASQRHVRTAPSHHTRPAVNGTSERLAKNHQNHAVSPGVTLERKELASSGGFHHDRGKKEGEGRTGGGNSNKQASKVKQFFTTIQQHANKLGSEVAEQVQELIHALVNETATVEEFHQEIQTIMNYPLKDFIIPFLRDNIGYLRVELKGVSSSQVLSDMLGEVPTSSAGSLTPQLVDDELPVLPSSSSKASAQLPIRTVSSSLILSSASRGSSSSSLSSSTTRTSIPHPNTTAGHHGTRTTTQSHSTTTRVHAVHGIGTQTHGHSAVVGVAEDDGRYGNKHMRHVAIKRRRWSNEQGPSVMSVEKDRVSGTDKSWPKRARTETSDAAAIILHTPITSSAPPVRQPPPPAYHHAPPPPPTTHHVVAANPPSSSVAMENHVMFSPHEPMPRRRGTALSEDWGHIDMMLSSIQGMVEKTRQSMAVLKDRVSTTQAEMERRELDRDNIVQQRVSEAVEKYKLQMTEEKQRLLLEASKQLRDAVSSVKEEMEGKVRQAQSLAMQEAMKEVNTQSSSKEHCWNCGRRATETCSGCNKARYCGTFCQHKDWANHMHHCASGLQGQAEEMPPHDPNKHIHHHAVAIPGKEVLTAATTSRGIPIVTASHAGGQQHHRTVAIPVNLIGAPQEVNLRLTQAGRPMGHTELLIKAERT